MAEMHTVFGMALEQSRRFEVKALLVASNTGASAIEARKHFGPGCPIYAVGNPTSSHDAGLVHHSGISDEAAERLREHDITALYHPQSLFQKPVAHLNHKTLMELRQMMSAGQELLIEGVIYSALQLFGTGPRVCIEIAMMAGDLGVLEPGTDCISIARPGAWCNMPDASLVLTVDSTENLFRGRLRVKDVKLAPQQNDPWFTNQEVPW